MMLLYATAALLLQEVGWMDDKSRNMKAEKQKIQGDRISCDLRLHPDEDTVC